MKTPDQAGLTAPQTPEDNLNDKPEQQNAESKVNKARIMGASKDPNFEGSTIIKTEGADGRVIGYAIRKNKEGRLEGNEIRYQPDGKTGAVYQLHEADFDKLKESGVLESYEHELMIEGSKKIDDTKLSLLRLFMQGDKIDPSWGQAPQDMIESARSALKELTDADQEKIATDFFAETIGRDISNNKYAYHVYRHLKGSAFSKKFSALEDDRLKRAGYAGFQL